jgi:hypothetical protein
MHDRHGRRTWLPSTYPRRPIASTDPAVVLATLKMRPISVEPASPPACRPILTASARGGECAAMALGRTLALAPVDLRIGTRH